MKFIRNFILVIAIVSGGLYYTNPGYEAFSAFLAEYVQVELADEAPGESELGQAFRKGLGQIAGAAGGQLAERQDLGLASVYTIKMAGRDHVFVGIAGQFFPVKAS